MDTENKSCPEKGKRTKVMSVLVGMISSAGMAVIFGTLGAMGIAYAILDASIDDLSFAINEALEIHEKYESAETLPQRKAIEAEMDRLMKQSRFAEDSVAHLLLIQSIASSQDGGIRDQDQKWLERDERFRYSVRQFEGHQLKMFIAGFSDMLFEDEYQALLEVQKEGNYWPVPPMIQLREDERLALRECYEMLKVHYSSDTFFHKAHYLADIISPKLMAPQCNLHEEIRPRF